MRRIVMLAVLALACGGGEPACDICPDAGGDVHEGRPRCSCEKGGLVTGFVFEPADAESEACAEQQASWQDLAAIYCE
jgi:hypothetical protein